MAQFKNLIVTGNSRFIGTSTFNNIGGGTFTAPIYFPSEAALPSKTLSYVCGIDGFAQGGQMGWQATSGLSVGSAAKLTNERTIFGKSFNGSANVEGHGMFYGAYTSTAANRYSNGGVEVREQGLVGNAQSDIGYAPTIGFHWGGKVAASLLFHNDGNFYFRKQDGTTRASVDANLIGNASTATKATQDGSGNTITSYYCTLTTAQTISGVKTFSGANTHSGNNTFSGTNSFTGRNVFDASNSYNTSATQKFVVGNSSSAFVFGGDGLQCFTGTTSQTAKIMYAQYYGGGLQIGGGAQSDLTIKGHITPSDRNMYSLGTSSKYWYDVYSANFSGNNFYVIGDGGTAHMLYNGADECLEFIFS